MTVIFFIAQWFSIALRATAHGDHSHDVYMGPEHLVHYDQVPDNAFKKVGEDQLVGSFQFKNRDLPLRLWKNNLDQTNLNSDQVHFSGEVTDIPGSYIRMSSYNNSMEGIISLPKRGIIRLASASGFENIKGTSKVIAYHTDDLAHLSKGSFSHYEFWKPVESHLEKRGFGKRCQPRVVMAAGVPPPVNVDIYSKAEQDFLPKAAINTYNKAEQDLSSKAGINTYKKPQQDSSSRAAINTYNKAYQDSSPRAAINTYNKAYQDSSPRAAINTYNKAEQDSSSRAALNAYNRAEQDSSSRAALNAYNKAEQGQFVNNESNPQNRQQSLSNADSGLKIFSKLEAADSNAPDQKQQPKSPMSQPPSKFFQQPVYQYPQQQPQQQPRYQYPQQQPRYQYPQQQHPNYQYPTYQYSQPQARPGARPASRLTYCNAGLIADYSFYLSHRNKREGIENYMRSLFNEVSGHFTSQTGVQLVIKYMHIVKNPNDASGLGYNYQDPSSAVSYINKGSKRIPGFDAEDLCVVHILSSAKFTQQAVGVAFVGSVCSPGANAGISSDNYGKMSRSDFTSVIMHEIGHVFGSAHDTAVKTQAEKQQCVPSSNRYVMYPSVQGGSANAHRFSPCSLRSIQRTISNPKKQCWNSAGRRIKPTSKFAVSKPEMIVDYLKYDL